jgi:DNA segregation ATPase FtsK/SpoIIIE, S-DNA-T family
MKRPLAKLLDRRKEGTHYEDRMGRIVGVCQDLGLLWHEERITHRNGQWEMKRIDDVTPVREVHVTPQYEKYGLSVRPRVLERVKNLGPHFAYALNVDRVSVEVDGNVVYVRVPKEGGEYHVVTFEEAWRIAPNIPQGHLLLGVDENHRQVTVNFNEPGSVHAAVVGMTGSGKSTLMRTMVLSAQMIGGSQLALFDPTGGLEPLSGHPSVWHGGLFRQVDEIERGLEMLANVIGRRSFPLLFAFVDEVPDLVAQRPKIKEHLSRLAQAGRHAGLHLIVGAQHPLASELGAATLRNIAVRLLGRVTDPGAAYNASGRRDTGAEFLRGRGDFIVVNHTTLQHFQAAMAPAEQLAHWAQQFPPRKPRCSMQGSRPAPPDNKRLPPETSGSNERVLRQLEEFVKEHGELPPLEWIYTRVKEDGTT